MTNNESGPAAAGGRGVSALPLGAAAESRPDKMDMGSGRRQAQICGRASWVTADEGNGPSWTERDVEPQQQAVCVCPCACVCTTAQLV